VAVHIDQIPVDLFQPLPLQVSFLCLLSVPSPAEDLPYLYRDKGGGAENRTFICMRGLIFYALCITLMHKKGGCHYAHNH